MSRPPHSYRSEQPVAGPSRPRSSSSKTISTIDARDYHADSDDDIIEIRGLPQGARFGPPQSAAHREKRKKKQKEREQRRAESKIITIGEAENETIEAVQAIPEPPGAEIPDADVEMQAVSCYSSQVETVAHETLESDGQAKRRRG